MYLVDQIEREYKISVKNFFKEIKDDGDNTKQEKLHYNRNEPIRNIHVEIYDSQNKHLLDELKSQMIYFWKTSYLEDKAKELFVYFTKNKEAQVEL